MTAIAARLRDRRAPVTLLAVAMAVSGVVLLVLETHITFFLDDWAVLLHRRGFSADVVLDPNNQHPAMVPVLLYKALLATFGMDSARPFQVVEVLSFLLADALLFVWLRRRVGAWLALAAVVPVLFLGSAYEDLLWQFQVGYFGSMACGLGMLLALDRDDRIGDRWACALLAASMTFSSVGLAFLAPAAVHVVWDRRRRARAYVVLIPAALYALWWLGWGHTAEHTLGIKNVATSASYIIDGLSSSLSSLLGLATARADSPLTPLDWGRPLLLAFVAVAAWRVMRIRPIGRSLVAVTVLALVFWFLAAANTGLARAPSAPRYQYVGAVMLLLIGAELLRGVRIGRVAGTIVAAAVVIATLGNLVFLDQGRDRFADMSTIERGGLAGLEISRQRVAPEFTLNGENSNAFYADLVDAASYFSAVDAFGSPAYSLAELPTAPEPAREAADKVLAAGLGVALMPATGRPRVGEPPAPVAPAEGESQGACLRTVPSAGAPAIVRLPPGGALVRPGSSAAVKLSLRRYSTESFPVDLRSVAGGTVALVPIPTDPSSQPWELELDSPGPVSVCGLAPARS